MEVSELPTVHNVFAKELALIGNDVVRDFVTDAFGKLCPSYFWHIPASVRGHHPTICRVRGGLVHHTKLGVRFGHSFCDMWNIEDVQHDMIIAALLLHDMMKRGWFENALETWHTHKQAIAGHGRFCADQLREHMDVTGVRGPIIRAVELHMGRWTWEIAPDEMLDLAHDPRVRMTHLADYAASRSLHKWLGERDIDDTLGYLRD